MKFSYNWLQSFFKNKLPKPEKLAELLTLKAFEVSEIKKIGKDWLLDIDVLPNRAGDCFSHLGIAREISVITGLTYRSPTSIVKEDKNLKSKDFISVEVKDKTVCPRYTARAIVDVKVGSSPKWMQERLSVCGLRPINNIVDITNYVMLETGQPLHAFDAEKLEGKKILVRFARKGEKITTLDNVKYNLDKDISVIADEKNPVGIAGIKGGKIPEIDAKTKIVVLEAANFERKTIRRGSKKLNLKTDASLRFEHGITPNLTESAANRAICLMQEIAGGKIAQGLIDFYPQKVKPKKLKLDLDYAKSLLGIEIPKKEVLKILKKLEFKILHSKFNILDIEAPTFRLDINLQEDLIEEIGRIYGYEKIPAVFPVASLIPPKRNFDIFWENLSKDILKEAGFAEVYNSSFIGDREATIFRHNKEKMIELENPTSKEQRYLRPSLIPGILKNIKSNKQFKEIKIFELEKIFFKKQTGKGKKQMTEKRMLTGAMTGEAFYEVKGVMDSLFNKLGIADVWYDEYKPTSEDSELDIWNREIRAEIKIDGEEVGFLGEISSRVLEESEIEQKTVIFDLDFEKVAKLSSEEREYKPISRYPSAVRDLAILVPRQVKVEEVLNIIEITGGSLLVDTDLFDIYEGEELPEDKKNLAFRLVYQAEDRTLSSKEIDEIQQKIIKALEEEPDWQVRK